MSEWIGYIGAFGLGAVMTEMVRGAFSLFMHKRQWSDEIKKTVIEKKLQVSEDAMACLQSFVDELIQIKFICQVEKDIPSNYLTWCQNLEEHMKALYPEVQSNVNRLCVYYDFSSIEEQFNIHRVMEDFNKDIRLFTDYSSRIVDSEPTSMGRIRLIEGNQGDIKPLFERLGNSVQTIIDYVEATQSQIRDEIKSYCK